MSLMMAANQGGSEYLMNLYQAIIIDNVQIKYMKLCKIKGC